MRIEILYYKINNVIKNRDMTQKEAANEIGISQSAMTRIMNKTQDWVYPDIADKISIWLSKNGEPIERSTIDMMTSRFKEVYVWGMAQAANMPSPPVGDIPPTVHESELPSIIWAIGNGPKYLAGFKVEGNSMEPTLKSGWIVICDCFAKEFRNGDIVVAKFDDKAVLKRYRRSEDTIMLTSDNPVGESFAVHAANINWLLKVIGFQGVI